MMGPMTRDHVGNFMNRSLLTMASSPRKTSKQHFNFDNHALLIINDSVEQLA